MDIGNDSNGGARSSDLIVQQIQTSGQECHSHKRDTLRVVELTKTFYDLLPILNSFPCLVQQVSEQFITEAFDAAPLTQRTIATISQAQVKHTQTQKEWRQFTKRQQDLENYKQGQQNVISYRNKTSHSIENGNTNQSQIQSKQMGMDSFSSDTVKNKSDQEKAQQYLTELSSFFTSENQQFLNISDSITNFQKSQGSQQENGSKAQQVQNQSIQHKQQGTDKQEQEKRKQQHEAKQAQQNLQNKQALKKESQFLLRRKQQIAQQRLKSQTPQQQQQLQDKGTQHKQHFVQAQKGNNTSNQLVKQLTVNNPVCSTIPNRNNLSQDSQIFLKNLDQKEYITASQDKLRYDQNKQKNQEQGKQTSKSQQQGYQQKQGMQQKSKNLSQQDLLNTKFQPKFSQSQTKGIQPRNQQVIKQNSSQQQNKQRDASSLKNRVESQQGLIESHFNNKSQTYLENKEVQKEKKKLIMMEDHNLDQEFELLWSQENSQKHNQTRQKKQVQQNNNGQSDKYKDSNLLQKQQQEQKRLEIQSQKLQNDRHLNNTLVENGKSQGHQKSKQQLNDNKDQQFSKLNNDQQSVGYGQRSSQKEKLSLQTQNQKSNEPIQKSQENNQYVQKHPTSQQQFKQKSPDPYQRDRQAKKQTNKFEVHEQQNKSIHENQVDRKRLIKQSNVLKSEDSVKQRQKQQVQERQQGNFKQQKQIQVPNTQVLVGNRQQVKQNQEEHNQLINNHQSPSQLQGDGQQYQTQRDLQNIQNLQDHYDNLQQSQQKQTKTQIEPQQNLVFSNDITQQHQQKTDQQQFLQDKPKENQQEYQDQEPQNKDLHPQINQQWQHDQPQVQIQNQQQQPDLIQIWQQAFKIQPPSNQQQQTQDLQSQCHQQQLLPQHSQGEEKNLEIRRISNENQQDQNHVYENQSTHKDEGNISQEKVQAAQNYESQQQFLQNKHEANNVFPDVGNGIKGQVSDLSANQQLPDQESSLLQKAPLLQNLWLQLQTQQTLQQQQQQQNESPLFEKPFLQQQFQNQLQQINDVQQMNDQQQEDQIEQSFGQVNQIENIQPLYDQGKDQNQISPQQIEVQPSTNQLQQEVQGQDDSKQQNKVSQKQIGDIMQAIQSQETKLEDIVKAQQNDRYHEIDQEAQQHVQQYQQEIQTDQQVEVNATDASQFKENINQDQMQIENHKLENNQSQSDQNNLMKQDTIKHNTVSKHTTKLNQNPMIKQRQDNNLTNAEQQQIYTDKSIKPLQNSNQEIQYLDPKTGILHILDEVQIQNSQQTQEQNLLVSQPQSIQRQEIKQVQQPLTQEQKQLQDQPKQPYQTNQAQSQDTDFYHSHSQQLSEHLQTPDKSSFQTKMAPIYQPSPNMSSSSSQLTETKVRNLAGMSSILGQLEGDFLKSQDYKNVDIIRQARQDEVTTKADVLIGRLRERQNKDILGDQTRGQTNQGDKQILNKVSGDKNLNKSSGEDECLIMRRQRLTQGPKLKQKQDFGKKVLNSNQPGRVQKLQGKSAKVQVGHMKSSKKIKKQKNDNQQQQVVSEEKIQFNDDENLISRLHRIKKLQPIISGSDKQIQNLSASKILAQTSAGVQKMNNKTNVQQKLQQDIIDINNQNLKSSDIDAYQMQVQQTLQDQLMQPKSSEQNQQSNQSQNDIKDFDRAHQSTKKSRKEIKDQKEKAQQILADTQLAKQLQADMWRSSLRPSRAKTQVVQETNVNHMNINYNQDDMQSKQNNSNIQSSKTQNANQLRDKNGKFIKGFKVSQSSKIGKTNNSVNLKRKLEQNEKTITPQKKIKQANSQPLKQLPNQVIQQQKSQQLSKDQITLKQQAGEIYKKSKGKIRILSRAILQAKNTLKRKERYTKAFFFQYIKDKLTVDQFCQTRWSSQGEDMEKYQSIRTSLKFVNLDEDHLMKIVEKILASLSAAKIDPKKVSFLDKLENLKIEADKVNAILTQETSSRTFNYSIIQEWSVRSKQLRQYHKTKDQVQQKGVVKLKQQYQNPRSSQKKDKKVSKKETQEITLNQLKDDNAITQRGLNSTTKLPDQLHKHSNALNKPSQRKDLTTDFRGSSKSRLQIGNLQFGGLQMDHKKWRHMSSVSKKLKLGHSMIHQWGVFAQEDVQQDEFIAEYKGEIIRLVVADRREKEYEKRGIGSSYLFRLDDEYCLDATFKGSLARYLNHSCGPNCYTKIISVEGQRRIGIYAITNIIKGQELFYDYKFNYEEEDRKVACFCLAPNCRGFMN